MHLDWRCDTRMHGRQSESYSNHTNGIQEILCTSMQACHTHDSCCLIFIATSTAQWQLINDGILKPMSPTSLPQSTRGITACRRHPHFVNHVKKLAMVILSVVFIPPPFPMFSHCSLFQFNWCSVAGADDPLSVHKGNKFLSPPYTAHKPYREAGEGELACGFNVFSTIPHYSHHCIFNWVVIPSMVPLALPQLTRGIKTHHCHPPLTSHMEEAARVSFPLPFIFSPPFQTFSHSIFFQLNCSSVSPAGHPPSVNTGNKGPLPWSLLVTCLQKAMTVSFPLVFIFPHHSKFFSWHLFQIKLLLCPWHWLSSLSQ